MRSQSTRRAARRSAPSHRLEPMERRMLLSAVSSLLDARSEADVVIPSTDVPKLVPPGAPGTTSGSTSSVINVAGQTGGILDIRVFIDITHTYNADLDVFLTSPAGTRVELFSDVGSNGDGLRITLDDSAATSVTSLPITSGGVQATGTYRPEQSMDAFDTQGKNGTWTLEITDDAGGDWGTLVAWSIIFPDLTPGTIQGVVFGDYNSNGTRETGEPGLSGWKVYIDNDGDSVHDASEPFVLSGADGAYAFPEVPPKTYTLRVVMQDGWVQTAPGSGGVVLEAYGPYLPAPEARDLKTRAYTDTEIVARIRGAGTLDDALNRLAPKARATFDAVVDAKRSSRMFSEGDGTLFELRLRSGVNAVKAAETLEAIRLVDWASPNYIYDDVDPREFVPNDPSYGSQYHHPLMQNNLSWDITLGSPSITIGITDDGVAWGHPDLAANIWTNPGEIAGNGIDDDGNGYIDDIRGWDFWTNDADPQPGSGSNDHGTHVAGIAAARTNNAVGVAGTAGGATIVPIRFYSTSGGTWTSTIVSNAYNYAANNGLKIVTTSYNVDGFANDPIFAAAVQSMYNGGVLHFNSAGNGNDLNPPRQKFDTTLYVANTTSTDTRSSSSNYGWGIDLAAPGTSILSSALGSSVTTYTYESFSGTSMASPNAAGVAALIWSANPTYTREQVAARLIGLADNIDAQNPSFVGLLGAGRVNSYKSLTGVLAPPKVKPNALIGLPAEGATVTSAPTSFTLDIANVFDPSTFNLGGFELRGDGIDGIFGTADDTFVSLSLPAGFQYMVGTNRVSFTISGSMGSDRYRFSALPTLLDPFGQALDGNRDGIGGDAFTRTFTLAGPTNSYTVNVASGAVVSGADFGNRDGIRPTTQAAAYANAASQAVTYSFSKDVSASFTLDDLQIIDLATSLPASIAGATITPSGTTVTVTFSNLLPNGNYVARLDAAGIADAYGNLLISAPDVPFTVFAGDIDGNGVIDVADLGVLSSNWMQPGAAAQGDLNYDGYVDVADLGILATYWNTSLPTAPALASAAPGQGVFQTRRAIKLIGEGVEKLPA